ncbi:MAG: STAS domain-containing protein [Bacilli bacterium]|nr:STAS domain-containing protein [Bacilli bacterium]
MLYMDLEYRKGVLFVRLDGNLTRKNTYKLNNYLTPVLLKHRIKFLVYNLFSVIKVDESGIDSLLRTKHAIKSNHGSIYLCEVPDHLKKEVKRLRIKETDTELSALDILKV